MTDDNSSSKARDEVMAELRDANAEIRRLAQRSAEHAAWLGDEKLAAFLRDAQVDALASPSVAESQETVAALKRGIATLEHRQAELRDARLAARRQRAPLAARAATPRTAPRARSSRPRARPAAIARDGDAAVPPPEPPAPVATGSRLDEIGSILVRALARGESEVP
jgi:hypothetical protein